jgi:hypothetical protein
MKTSEIEMLPRSARTEAERYARCRDLSKTDRAIMRAYKSIARGGRIIDLQKTMAIGGFDEHGRPKLALAMAHSSRVNVRVWAGSTEFRSDQGSWKKRETRIIDFGHGKNGLVEAWAKLPYIPPYIRRSNMGQLYVLWEATWFKVPAGDPYLLEKIDDNLYRVIAAWDITPLEAAILRR